MPPTAGVRSRRRPTADPVRAPPPVTLEDRVALEMRKFISSANLFNAQAAEKVGLGPTDLQLVNVLHLYGPSTPGRLGAVTCLSSGGVTVALDRLEKAGYIRRQPNPDDRRSLLVVLVPSAVAKLKRLFEGVQARGRALINTLPERDLEAVLRFFEAMNADRLDAGADDN
jgi:MarR family transcriptional regulator, organic hydroperoxide resistance regulator